MHWSISWNFSTHIGLCSPDLTGSLAKIEYVYYESDIPKAIKFIISAIFQSRNCKKVKL